MKEQLSIYLKKTRTLESFEKNRDLPHFSRHLANLNKNNFWSFVRHREAIIKDIQNKKNNGCPDAHGLLRTGDFGSSPKLPRKMKARVLFGSFFTQNQPKSKVVFGSFLGRRLSIWQNSTGFLHHFSARIFLASPFGSIYARFPANWRKCSQHNPKFAKICPNWVSQKWNVACFGSPWLCLGWKPVYPDPNRTPDQFSKILVQILALFCTSLGPWAPC